MNLYSLSSRHHPPFLKPLYVSPLACIFYSFGIEYTGYPPPLTPPDPYGILFIHNFLGKSHPIHLHPRILALRSFLPHSLYLCQFDAVGFILMHSLSWHQPLLFLSPFSSSPCSLLLSLALPPSPFLLAPFLPNCSIFIHLLAKLLRLGIGWIHSKIWNEKFYLIETNE